MNMYNRAATDFNTFEILSNLFHHRPHKKMNGFYSSFITLDV